MTTKTCEYCDSEYNTDTISIPEPLPDYMCAYCGTLHTENKVKELVLSHCKTHGINPEKYGH